MAAQVRMKWQKGQNRKFQRKNFKRREMSVTTQRDQHFTLGAKIKIYFLYMNLERLTVVEDSGTSSRDQNFPMPQKRKLKKAFPEISLSLLSVFSGLKYRSRIVTKLKNQHL